MRTTSLRRDLTFLMCSTLLCFATVNGAARAATFTVDDPSDAVDSSPGDGTCATASGACTLRAAVQETNALAAAGSSEPARIELPADTYLLAIAGSGEDEAATGDLDLNTSVTLAGAGAGTTVVDGADLDRVFDVAPVPIGPIADIEVTLEGLTVQGGQSPEPESGGGIRFASRLVVQQAVISGNTSTGEGGGLGYYNADGVEPYLAIVDSTVSDNEALQTFLGSADGGGIHAGPNTFVLTRSVLSNNRTANSGGGLWGTTCEITDSTLSGNAASGGGGLDCTGATITGTTFSDNVAESGVGGGLNLTGPLVTTITNSTISGNSASYEGAGIFVGGGGGSLTLTYVTVSNNMLLTDESPTPGAGITKASGFEVKPVYLQNTIVALNDPSDCAGVEFTSNGNNLDSDDSCEFDAPSDLSGVDPLLDPLADNGGITQTQALRGGSPAIDAAAAIPGVTVDQRGFPRPGAGSAATDIGAYEKSAMPPDHPDKHKKLKRLLELLLTWFH